MVMKAPGASIVLTPAISGLAIKAVICMSEEQFNNEKLYQVTMTIVRSMLDKGMISTDEYTQIDTMMQEKYKPSLGTLFTDIRLT